MCKNVFETGNRDGLYINFCSKTSRGIDLSYRIGLFAQQWNFTSLLGKSRDIVTRKFTQPRGSLLYELLPTVPPALRLRFDELFLFFIYFSLVEGKGRDWKGRRTDNSVDCTRVAFGSRKLGAKREEGGGNKESGRAVSCVVGVVTIVNLWTSYRK